MSSRRNISLVWLRESLSPNQLASWFIYFKSLNTYQTIHVALETYYTQPTNQLENTIHDMPKESLDPTIKWGQYEAFNLDHHEEFLSPLWNSWQHVVELLWEILNPSMIIDAWKDTLNSPHHQFKAFKQQFLKK